jgi:nucleoside 2-deoxyribosyltransferase
LINIYLSGGIKGLTDEQAYGWRKAVIKHYQLATGGFGHSGMAPEELQASSKCLHYGVNIIVPSRMQYRDDVDLKSASLWVIKRDKISITQSDIVLTYCPVPSWGTAMEIMYAHELDKWIVVICDDDNPSPWLVAHADVIVPGLDLAYDEIDKIAKDMRSQMP